MTMTDYQATTDYGDAGSLGSGPASPRRRSRAELPAEYRRSVFEREEVRALVADALTAQVEQMRDRTGELGVQFAIRALDEVVNELRGF